MRKLLIPRRCFLFPSVALLAGVAMAALAGTATAVKNPRTMASPQEQTIKSNKVNYEGKVVFETVDKKTLNGTGYLYLDGRNFALTYGDQKYTGELVSLISGGIPGGHI